MARSAACLLLLAGLLATATAGPAPPTCSAPAFAEQGTVYTVEDGNITIDGGAGGEAADDAAAALAAAQDAFEQLAAGVAAELHKDEGCEVTSAVPEIACSKAVTEGDELEGGSTAAATGTLFDMEVVEAITCKDGSYKVRYEARGIKTDGSDELVEIQTRFIEVFDSSYTSGR